MELRLQAGWEPDLAFGKQDGLPDVSFTVLAPTDDAFAAINITAILRNATSPAALLNILKLHILPSKVPVPLDPKIASRSVVSHLAPPEEGAPSRPLAIEEDIAYQTLLSATSRFGDLAFRQTRDAFVVGIKGARGIELNDWADVGVSGRATPQLYNSSPAAERLSGEPEDGPDLNHRPLINGVTQGGGVFLIECVLTCPRAPSCSLPIDPSCSNRPAQCRTCAIRTLLGAVVWLDPRRLHLRRGRRSDPARPRRLVALEEAAVTERYRLRAGRGGGRLILAGPS